MRDEACAAALSESMAAEKRKGRGCAPPDNRELASSSGGALDTATVLRVFLKERDMERDQNHLRNWAGFSKPHDLQRANDIAAEVRNPIPIASAIAPETRRKRSTSEFKIVMRTINSAMPMKSTIAPA